MPSGTTASFVLFAFIFGFRPHMVSAGTAEQHAAVETMMCNDLPMICPCHAYNLRVSQATGGALKCGESQTKKTMEYLPIIQPPAGVMIDMAADINTGNIRNGTAGKIYAGPSPSQYSGDHSYQILLLKQDPSVAVVVPTGTVFDAQSVMQTSKMCEKTGHLIGAFEFSCSFMNRENQPVIPGRPCPDPSASTTSITGTTLGPTDTSRAGTSTLATNGTSTRATNGISTLATNGISTLATSGISTLATNDITTISSNERSTHSSNETSTLSSNGISMLSSNSISRGDRGNGISTLSSNEKSTLSTNEKSTLSTNEKSTLSTNDKTESHTSSSTTKAGSTRSLRCDIYLAIVAAILFRVLLL